MWEETDFFPAEHWMKFLVYFWFVFIDSYELWLNYLNHTQYNFFSLKGLPELNSAMWKTGFVSHFMHILGYNITEWNIR